MKYQCLKQGRTFDETGIFYIKSENILNDQDCQKSVALTRVNKIPGKLSEYRKALSSCSPT